ncbi:O-antigen ligase family protein [uncultured Parabacteroides sp.]|uniref:O-antigen ligase family protein n=1 Tax=uncultured Parabacteroides sp. TaxID=512312 RepID=UPI00258C2ACB|nr:O-antigen ligase family protein [uncultured Parabacteroides sp.]
MKTGTIDSLSRILLFNILLLSFTKVSPDLPAIPDPVYYASFVAALFWMVFRGGLAFTYTWLPFLISILFSVWVNDIPAYFQVGFRVIGFMAVTLVVGPFLVNPILVVWRRLLFVHSLTFIRWIVILTFQAWIICPELVQGRSGFEGFTNQSMLLGTLSGISFIYSLYLFYLSSKLLSKYLEVGIAIVSLLILILAGSRSALGSTMCATAFFYSRIYRHHVMRLGKICFTVLCVTLLTSSFWWIHTERLRSKMEIGEKGGSVTMSRDGLWNKRMDEFKAYPFFGVGFATMNKEAVSRSSKSGSGTIEPGSSWLFLLSSMGLMGFLSFSILFFRSLYFLFIKESVGINGYFIGSLLFLFLFHMIFEGYVIASGAYLCFFLWLLLSECGKVVNINNRLI